jgi:hypothetical protein
MGKIAKVSRPQNWKKKHCCKHIHNSFLFGRIFALCLQNKLEIWKFSFFLL